MAESLTALQADNKATQRSLGIIRPDPGSVEFRVKRIEDTAKDNQEVTAQVFEQASLLEDPLKPMPKPEYSFRYAFTSGGKTHDYQIHDWEVQAAYFNYRRQYGREAMDRLIDVYQNTIPNQHLHLIMGTMQKRPWQFIIIGLLRAPLDPKELEMQGELF